MKLEFTFEKSQAYVPKVEGLDLREDIHPKKDSTRTFEPYYQVFQDRFPFEKNLSILDLLFNMGPQSKKYLSRIV